MRYLGVDQSLSGTGLCLLGSQGEVLALQTVDPGKRRDAERLAFIRDAVRELFPDVSRVAFEGYSYGSFGNAHFQLGEIGGVLQVAAWDAGISYETVPPALLKKYANGNPHATKEAVIEAAQRLGITPEDDNQADAFFLASIAKDLDAKEMPRTRARIEVIHRIRNPKVKTTRRVRTFVKHAI